jgi:small-conductance mechanosensitive channel
MRFIFFLLFIFSSIYCASIDTKLYDNKQNSDYLIEIEKTIQKEIKNNEKPQQILKDELKYLKILKESNSKIVKIDNFKNEKLTNLDVVFEDIIKAIKFLIQLNYEYQQTIILSKNVQDNLSFLKKKIENILEIEKDKLLIYQLQFAYYKIEKNNLEKKELLYENEKEEIYKQINTSISNLKVIDESLIDSNLKQNESELEQILEKNKSLENDLQIQKLQENYQKIEILQKELNKSQILYQTLLIENIFDLLKKAILSIKEKDETKYLNIYKKINNNLSILNKENKKYLYIDNILKQLSKKSFNTTKLAFATTSTKVDSLYDLAKSFLNTNLFVFNEQAITPLSILKALLLIILGIFIGKLYKKWLLKISSKWPNISDMSLKVTSNVGFYLIVFITFMIAIGSLGIDMTSISLIAGALSIGIGFGLQTVVSNFIAGIILMFERTIRIGDVIEISDVLKGTVTDIRVRSTSIKTFDNIDIVVPNSSFIQNNVINWTLEDKSRRLHVPFGVAYGTKIERVKELVLEELKNSDLKYIRDDKDKQPEIRFENMNSSSVDLELLVYIRINDRITPNSLKSDFMLLIYNALYKHNIEIPFPQLDLHIKKATKPSL